MNEWMFIVSMSFDNQGRSDD